MLSPHTYFGIYPCYNILTKFCALISFLRQDRSTEIYLALELWEEFNNRVFRLNWVTKDNCFRIGLLAQWSYVPQLPLSFLCMLMYFSNLGWYLQSSSRVIRMNEHTQSKISDNKSSLKYILDLHRHTNNFLKSSSNQLNFHIQVICHLCHDIRILNSV